MVELGFMFLEIIKKSHRSDDYKIILVSYWIYFSSKEFFIDFVIRVFRSNKISL